MRLRDAVASRARVAVRVASRRRRLCDRAIADLSLPCCRPYLPICAQEPCNLVENSLQSKRAGSKSRAWGRAAQATVVKQHDVSHAIRNRVRLRAQTGRFRGCSLRIGTIPEAS